MELIKEEDYDIVFADPMMKRMTEDAYKMAGTGCVADAYETKRKRIFYRCHTFCRVRKIA